MGRGLALSVRALPLLCRFISRKASPLGGGGTSRGEGVGAVAVAAATPVVGVPIGEQLSLDSLLLSSRRLALLARSHLLLPD